MSYIRCLSNPEGLYIWEDVNGGVAITWCNVKPPLCHKHNSNFAAPMMLVPTKAFKKVCCKWGERFSGGPVEADGFVVAEKLINTKTGKRIAKDASPEEYADEAYLVRVSYKRKFVYLWRVTWMYVVRSVQRAREIDAKIRNARKKA